MASHQKQKRCRRQSKMSKIISYEESVEKLSEEGRSTVEIVNSKTNQRALGTIPKTRSAVFDKTWPSYKWLRSGWIVEERTMLSTGRLYRYYYDRLGQLYSTMYAVEYIHANIEEEKEEKEAKEEKEEKEEKEKKPEVIIIDDDE